MGSKKYTESVRLEGMFRSKMIAQGADVVGINFAIEAVQYLRFFYVFKSFPKLFMLGSFNEHLLSVIRAKLKVYFCFCNWLKNNVSLFHYMIIIIFQKIIVSQQQEYKEWTARVEVICNSCCPFPMQNDALYLFIFIICTALFPRLFFSTAKKWKRCAQILWRAICNSYRVLHKTIHQPLCL